jgi:chemotaxis regulatin CheY-phosphate phosphatase CheZ
MNSLVTDANLDIDIKMEAADGIKTTEDNNAGFMIKLKGFEGDQRLSMNTHALESKIGAFKLINMISESMGTAFAPYTEALLPIMVSNMTYKYSKAVRKFSMKTVNNMLTAVGEPSNVALFQNLLPQFMTMMTTSLEKEDLKELKIVLKHFWLMVKNLNETNKTSKNYLTEQQLTTLGQTLNKVLSLVSEAKKETVTLLSSKKHDLDEEDIEAMKDNLAKLTAPSTYVMEISG